MKPKEKKKIRKRGNENRRYEKQQREKPLKRKAQDKR
jgi:hypothetical protein